MHVHRCAVSGEGGLVECAPQSGSSCQPRRSQLGALGGEGGCGWQQLNLHPSVVWKSQPLGRPSLHLSLPSFPSFSLPSSIHPSYLLLRTCTKVGSNLSLISLEDSNHGNEKKQGAHLLPMKLDHRLINCSRNGPSDILQDEVVLLLYGFPYIIG